MQIVEEVKQALQRARILPDSQEKHERFSALASKFPTWFDRLSSIPECLFTWPEWGV